MPHYRLTVLMPAGHTVVYYTQDPEGMAERFRDGGIFVSHNVPRVEWCGGEWIEVR